MERLELARLLRASLPAEVKGVGIPPQAAPGAGRVVVEERDPLRFMGALASAVEGTGRVFLADPHRGRAGRSATDLAASQDDARADPSQAQLGWLMIPSGGTGGGLKLARHDHETLSAAVDGFSRFFGAGPVNSLGILPLHHVSGLMAWMRSALTGGEYKPWDWKRLEEGGLPELAAGRWFLSMVPTQLQRLLASASAVGWMRGFSAVFVGGGPVWPELASAAADARLPVSLSYGTTETAAMVAALRPEDFLAGERSSGEALPHASIDLTPDGVVRVAGPSLFRGYYPDWLGGDADCSEPRRFLTGDLCTIDGRGRLHILGRGDLVIITGGRKADPLEIERALLATGEFSDVVVVGVPDPEWGEAVVACYPAGQKQPDAARVARGLADLPAFKRPRRFEPVPDWPRNPQGKVDRRALLGRLPAPGVNRD